MQPTAIDLFCGAGGFSLGLSQAGYDVRIAFDNDPKAVATYHQNLGIHGIQRDLEATTAATILDRAGLKPGDCTLLAGGPPCQGFSVQRRGPNGDARNILVNVFLALALEIKPLFFVLENVPGLLSKRGMDFFTAVQRRARQANYALHVKKLNAADYGVPQIRYRVIIVGERRDAGKTYFRFPQATHSKVTWRTVRQALEGLPSPPEDGTAHPQWPNHFREAKLAEINLQRISHIPEGGGREFLPDHLQLPCHKNNVRHRHLDVYGRLSWDKPAVTLTARFDSFTRGRFAHPSEHRSLTLREGARLQTFPDTFEFLGNREEIARQIGNAVPPMLANALGTAALDALRNREKGEPSLEHIPDQLSLLDAEACDPLHA